MKSIVSRNTNEYRPKTNTRKDWTTNTRNTTALRVAIIAAFFALAATRADAYIVDWTPVGITLGQTARLTFANIGESHGVVINWRFLDSDGAVITQSERPLTVPFGTMTSVEVNRDTINRTDARIQIRAEVESLTSGTPGKILRESLEVFDNASGKTTVFIGDPNL